MFLGPSLPAAEARRIARCRVLPPARAGDVLALLPGRPLAIALVDGVFEASPSVWHHEILAALDAGIAVFGASSMGALRAAELAPFGMIGVGGIAAAYRRGEIVDDADVALLHAGETDGFRPLTVPLVTARAVVEAARAEGVLTRAQAAAVHAAAGRAFYQDRHWPAVLDAARLAPATRAAFLAFLPHAPDPKADDARACLAAAAEYVRARRAGAPPPPPPAISPPPSHLRRLRLEVATCVLPSGAHVGSREVLGTLARRPEAGRLAADGLRRSVIASLARGLGLSATGGEIAAAERAWLVRLGVRARQRDRFLAACGLDDGAARRLAEDLALEARLLDDAARAVPDGPSWEEGLALGARLSGAWAEEATRLALVASGKPRRSRAR